MVLAERIDERDVNSFSIKYLLNGFKSFKFLKDLKYLFQLKLTEKSPI